MKAEREKMDRIVGFINRYIDSHGGGNREIHYIPGPYWGYHFTVVWDGFATLRHPIRAIMLGVNDELGNKYLQEFSRLHCITFKQMEEEGGVPDTVEPAFPVLATSRH